MDSAVPEHLRTPQDGAGRAASPKPPAYPAWVARFDPAIEQVVMAYFGVQRRPGTAAEASEPFSARFSASDGPLHWERARYTDAEGCDTVIAIAYWSDPARFRAWRAGSGFDDWWQDPRRLREPCGYFLETVTPTADRFETLFSAPKQSEGIGHLRRSMSGEIKEHGYWGSARDRIPLSGRDPLHPGAAPAAPAANTFGKRILVPGRDNLCLIRSGQDWSATAGSERALYLDELQPKLAAGMAFLRDEGRKIGCLSCRYMTVLDHNNKATEKTFGLAHFDCLASLESWARTHPSHLAIFGGFQKYVRDLDYRIALRLYHEVSVVPASSQQFDYLNCHPGTGLLGR